MARVVYPIEHFAKLQDKGGNKFQMRWYSTGVDPLLANDLMGNWAPALEALTQCKILETGWVYRMVEADQTPASTDGEGEKKAMISVKLVTETPPNPGQTKVSQILIPAPVESLFLATAGAGANIVDVTNADLQEFLYQFTEGLGVLPSLTLSDFQLADDATVEGNVAGKRVTRKSNKG